MKMQVAVALVAVLGLSGCGGGGGGGGSGEPDRSGETPAPAPSVTAAQLVGTWVQTNVNYADPTNQGALEWVKTRRQTIIVERVSGVLRFRDCISGVSLNANLSNNTITFPAQPGLTLNVADASNITTTVIQAGAETDVTLQKVSSNTLAVLADIDATVDLAGQSVDRSQWNQVCVETIVDKYAADSVELKAAGSESGISGTVTLKFQTADHFTQGQYNYPSAGNSLTGTFSVNSLLLNTSGALSNPSGSMILIQGGTTDMYFDVVMDSTSGAAPVVGIDGVANLEPFWFDGEPE